MIVLGEVCFLFLLLNSIVSITAFSAASVHDTKIIGGTEAVGEQVPYQVSLRLKAEEIRGFGKGHLCGGSVISDKTILTAAHCLLNSAFNPAVQRNANEFTVVMGSVLLLQLDASAMQVDVAKVFVHSEFDMNTLINDIGMVLIQKRIPRSFPSVQAIPISNAATEAGWMCEVTGWGSTRETSISNTLLTASVPLIDSEACAESYYQIGEQINPKMLCAGYILEGGKDACQGDSGGPLACNGSLVGIVSWGAGCGQPGYPGVYTDVFQYRRWISVINETLYNRSSGLERPNLILVFVVVLSFVCFGH